MSDLSLTLVQTALHWHNPAENRAMFSQVLAEINQPTDLIILPEMFSTGFTMDAINQAETMDGPTIAWMRQTATQKNVVLTGSVVIQEDGEYYNRLIWMRPDGSYEIYNKRHLFRMAEEHRHYSEGNSRLVVELKGWRICPLICYDLRFPVWSRNRQDYDLLIYVANWPAKRRFAWQSLLKARAIENLSYVIGVNRIGEDGNQVTYTGDSAALDFVGQPLFEQADTPFIHTLSLSQTELFAYREQFPAYMDADEFEINLASTSHQADVGGCSVS